jgi:hypothetical protein
MADLGKRVARASHLNTHPQFFKEVTGKAMDDDAMVGRYEHEHGLSKERALVATVLNYFTRKIIESRIVSVPMPDGKTISSPLEDLPKIQSLAKYATSYLQRCREETDGLSGPNFVERLKNMGIVWICDKESVTDIDPKTGDVTEVEHAEWIVPIDYTNVFVIAAILKIVPLPIESFVQFCVCQRMNAEAEATAKLVSEQLTQPKEEAIAATAELFDQGLYDSFVEAFSKRE